MPAHPQNSDSWVVDDDDGQFQTGTFIDARPHQFSQTNTPSNQAAQCTTWGRNNMTGAGALSSAVPASRGFSLGFDYHVNPDGYPMDNPYNNPYHDGHNAEVYRVDHKPPSNITDETVIGPNAEPNAGLDLSISLTPLVGSPVMPPAHPTLTQHNMSLHQRELEQFHTPNLEHWAAATGTVGFTSDSRAAAQARRHHRGHRAHLSVSSMGSASGSRAAPPSLPRPGSSLLSLCGSEFLVVEGHNGSVYGDEYEGGGEAGTARVAAEDVMGTGTWCG
ncbi:uncharacterized protein C8A04DRAFT_24238 [Dichotomopilus funicola]|uniref:Uncharacterized protein n=1 Tax=Dichotomopilus funicola TaxID=1934379 RepID=A0AAN6VCQ9_9PEZI|nr:hypothetical protein C8A04DRAFT_24238 [Dichotomopilus funicola]